MLRDIISTSLTRNIAFLFKLVLSIVVARQFGPEGKGLIVAFFLVPEFIAIIGSLSVDEASLYWIAKKQIRASLLKKVYFNLLILQTPILILLGAAYLHLFDYDYTLTELTLCLSLIPIYLLQETGRFSLRGLHDIRTFNQSILIENIVPLFFILILIIEKDIWWLIIGQSIGLLFSILFIWRNFLSSFKQYIVEEITIERASDVYLYGIKVHAYKVLNTLDAKIAALVISVILPFSELGIYSIAFTFSLLLQMGLQGPVSTVILPKLVNISETTRIEIVGLATRGMFFMSVIFLLSLLLFGKWLLVLIFGQPFEPAYWPMIIMVFGKVIKTPMATLDCYFKSCGTPEKSAKISVKAAPLSITLSMILIPLYGVMGAAVATVIANIVFGILMIRQYQKDTGIKLRDILIINRSDIAHAIEALMIVKARLAR